MNTKDYSLPPDNGSDWVGFLQSMEGTEKLDLNSLQLGDVIWLVTRNTNYRMELLEATQRWFQVTCDRPEKPSGRMRLNGCTFGMSSSIMPDALFLGGSAELRQPTDSDDNWLTHTTSAIKKISCVHLGDNNRESGE